MTTSALRTMKKYGGLDGYLLNTPERKLADSDFGLQLRYRIKEAVKANPRIIEEVAQAKAKAEAEKEAKRVAEIEAARFGTNHFHFISLFVYTSDVLL